MREAIAVDEVHLRTLFHVLLTAKKQKPTKDFCFHLFSAISAAPCRDGFICKIEIAIT